MGTKEKVEKESKYKETQKYNLILHNDDVNTFDYVIDKLVEICNHEETQAHQCAMITHYKGKCDVKNGDYDTLKLMKDNFVSSSLSVTIE